MVLDPKDIVAQHHYAYLSKGKYVEPYIESKKLISNSITANDLRI